MHQAGAALRVLVVAIIFALVVVFLVYPGVVYGHPIWGPWPGFPPGPAPTATATASPTSTAIPAATASPTATQPAPAATATSTQPAATATQTSIPAATAVPASATPIPTNTPTGGGSGSGTGAPASCTFPTPGSLDNMPKVLIEQASSNQWFHRVFNPRLFKAPNWDGADSWFVSLALGQNSGGDWTSHGNTGEIVYRATSTKVSWCLGVLTTSQWKEQFMGKTTTPAAVNVRIIPNSLVTVTGPSGTKSQTTSDAGDITITLPDNGVIVISVAYETNSPTHESLIWWGPQDRTDGINILDAR